MARFPKKTQPCSVDSSSSSLKYASYPGLFSHGQLFIIYSCMWARIGDLSSTLKLNTTISSKYTTVPGMSLTTRENTWSRC